jgi:signal transduction histidine kinase
MNAPNEQNALLLSRAIYFSALPMPVLFYHFLCEYLKLGNQKKINLIIFYLLTAVFFVFNCTNLFIKGVAPQLHFKYFGVPGKFYFVFLAVWMIILSFSCKEMLKAYKTSVGVLRNQLKYIIIASIFGFVGGSTAYLPAFSFLPFINTEFASYGIYGHYFVFLYAVVITNAIVKHRLMDIDFVIKKGAVYIYSTLFLVPLFGVLIIAQLLFFKNINIAFSALSIVVISIAAIIFPQIRLHAEQKVEQYIFKDKYDYKKTIGELSKAMVSILSLDEVCKKIITTTTEAMDVKKASIYILDEDKDRYVLCDSRGVTIGFGHVVDSYRHDDPFFKALGQYDKIIIREEIERFKDLSDSQLMIQMMTDMESEICIPFIAKSRLIGLINLGMKGNKRMYSHEDIEMLSTLANSAAIAIENAQLIENKQRTLMKMKHADRLAGIGQLAAGIAHEIRNPLVAIKTSAQLLPERYDDEEFRTYFSTIVASEIERATKKINDLLNYARPSAPFFQQENLNEIIETMVAFVKNDAYKKEQTIEIALSQNLPTVTLDKQQMKQVFINLLFNAIQSTPAKGKISITTRKRQKTNGLTDFIQVEISDTGVGIHEEDLEKIFTPFFTTKAKEEGSGLGLAMTHQIIEEHEGTIDVRSKINQGTTFTINLPVNPLIFKQNKNDAQNLH